MSEVTYIRSLEFANFKRFYGKHSIDLMPDTAGTQPLILVGGDNGRGKTSIHEAINYALYADDQLPGLQTRPSYLRAVSDRLNRDALDEGINDFWVAVDLVIETAMGTREVRLERAWDVDVKTRRATDFEVRIFEDGREMDYVDEYSYTEFIRRLCPSEIAPFFFFDGERIQELADDIGHDHSMVESIESILHIRVYKQLRNDLGKYVVDDLERQEIKPNAADDFYDLLKDADRIEQEVERKRNRLADVEREIEDLQRRSQQVKNELQRVAGSAHAPDRQSLIVRNAQIDAELEAVEERIRGGFSDLPIALCGRLVDEMIERVEAEAREIASPERLEELRKQLEELKRRVFEHATADPVAPPEVHEIVADLMRRFDQSTREVFDIEDDAPELLHDLGVQTRRQIISRASEATQRVSHLRGAIDKRETLENEKRDIDSKLMSISADPHVDQLIDDKEEIDGRLGELQEEERNLTADFRELSDKQKTRRRQIEDRRAQRKATTLARKQVQLAQQVRRTLDQFIQELGERKLSLLQSKLCEMYAQLRRPENPVTAIDIDPATWEVILRDAQGRELEKRVFSAGMKEMYALSLLWALGQTSGHKLPVVIDTPLGRLDSINRRALCENYFPNAGHQVVLLSTDEEIDRRWFEKLEPFVAKQYCLEHDRETNSTVIRPGYFF
jgi:DNA sulfur modification protein DndD